MYSFSYMPGIGNGNCYADRNTHAGLFAQGWIDLIAGPDVWPRLVFEGFDTTPWLFVFLFLGVWTIAVNIQKKSVEG